MRLITCALLLCTVITLYIPIPCDSCKRSKVIHCTYEVKSGSSEHSYQEVSSGGGADVRIKVNRHVTVEGDGGGLGLIHDLEREGVLSLSHTLKLGGISQRSKHIHTSISSKYGQSSRSKHEHSSSRDKHVHVKVHVSSSCKHGHGHGSKRCAKDKTDWRKQRDMEKVESHMCPGVVSHTTDRFRKKAVDLHNKFRSDLALGNLFNPKSRKMLRKANSMLRLNYGCGMDHEVLTDVDCKHQPRKNIPGYCDPAVNVYYSKSRNPIKALEEAVRFWSDDLQRRWLSIDQIQNLFYSHSGICNIAGMGSDLTTDVACGTGDCGDKTLVVCRYKLTKKLKNGMRWYFMGPTCRQCQKKWGTSICQDGLCVRD
ncbi:unnamed protein product [Cylicocyclus nassatus]|uniref:SCP domain-containing protein n=1 Tax=Cylicocyclus nassatus TaxID=53992 RepID=A0AA36DIJ2_CYLNA|nr:unnamed protein product [Cylicocyclus nassatus]